MKRNILKASILAFATIIPTMCANAQNTDNPSDSIYVPVRAIVLSGDRQKASDLVGILYDKSELHFSDPNSPRFLFLDREGKVAFGIGGYFKGTVQYDFDGAIDDGASFTTYDIPVPMNPGQRNQFYGNANHSTLLLQLVGRSSRFGYYQMYIQTNFSGNGNTGYGLKLKQAYVKVGNVTAGLTNSVMIDGAAGTPTIDDEGPSGELGNKTVLVKYTPRFNANFSGGIGVEYPHADYTTDASVEHINQRVPDIPLYVQYQWGGGKSHVRLSGLVRNLSYRDLIADRNRFKTGWAAQLSGMINFIPELTFYYQGAYGRGYAALFNDLSGQGFDLVHSSAPGKMAAPRTANFEVGMRCDINTKLFVAGSYSQARLYGLGYLGEDTYRYGQYVSVSGFFDIIPDVRIGLEYLHGTRTDYSGDSGHANRITGLLQYSF